MIHNFINKNKYFNDENLKNVLHIIFSNYDSNTTTINGLNTHIKTAVNTIYKDKDVNDLYEVLQNMKNTTVTNEELEAILNIDNTPISNNLNQNKDITKNLSKNAKKTLEDKVSSLLEKGETNATTIIPFSTVSMPVTVTTNEMKTALTDKAKKTLEHKVSSLLENKKTDATTVHVTVDTTKMKTALTDKAKKTLEHKVSSLLEKEKTDATTVHVTVDTTKMKTALTDKAKEILETKIKKALNKPAITVPDVDENRIKEALTDKAKETFNTDVLFKITNNSSDKVNPIQVIGVAPNNDTFVTEEMNYLSNTAKYMEEINICKNFPRKRFGIANPGAQCYSNALFQMLYSMPTMRKIFSTITIKDTNDSIGLLVNRFKEISNEPKKQIFTIGQNEEDTCLAKYFIPSEHLNYTNQNDTAELFRQIIVTSVQLRIYKYIFSRYHNDISDVNNFNNIPKNMKDNVKKAISYKLKQLKKTEEYDESFDILEQLYEKYVMGEIIEDEKNILFNSNDTNLNIDTNQHSNIIKLFDFIKSFTLKYKKQIVCSNDQLVVSKIDTLFSTELSIINETNNNFINNIQDAINYTEIKEMFTLDNQPSNEGCKNIGAKGNAIGILHKNEIPKDNKYLIFTLKRWHPITRNKIPHAVEPSKTIRINNIQYTLTGVICHTGDTRNSGHYFYYEYDHNGDIQYCYEDNNVNELQEDEVDKTIYDDLNTSNENYNVSNLTEEEQIKIAIDNSMQPQDKVNVSYYTNKKAATQDIKKNGYVFLYSRYPVYQDDPEKTEHELIAKNEELDTYEKIKNNINTNLINIAKKDFEDTTSIYYIKKILISTKKIKKLFK